MEIQVGWTTKKMHPVRGCTVRHPDADWPRETLSQKKKKSAKAVTGVQLRLCPYAQCPEPA